MESMRYKAAWDLQERLFEQVVAEKLRRRTEGLEHRAGRHYLLLGEHPDVFTLGRNGKEQHLLISETRRQELGIDYFRINRGGDITYHGPGQLVGYPILDLDCLFTDIGRYLRLIEECVILVLKDYGLKGERLPGATGVWLDPDNPFRARKICAIGIRASRWVTMHGFALNVSTDLSRFEFIVPCGLENKAVTSMSRELDREISLEEVRDCWLIHFQQLFAVDAVRREKFSGV